MFARILLLCLLAVTRINIRSTIHKIIFTYTVIDFLSKSIVILTSSLFRRNVVLPGLLNGKSERLPRVGSEDKPYPITNSCKSNSSHGFAVATVGCLALRYLALSTLSRSAVIIIIVRTNVVLTWPAEWEIRTTSTCWVGG